MTVFDSKVLKAYVILMWSGAVPWWGGGGEGGTGASPPPPPPQCVFFFFYIFFFFFACQLRAQSCTLMMIPLTHYDNFATQFFKVGEICVTVPVLHPPFFVACQLRGQSYMLMMITPYPIMINLSTKFFRSGGKCLGPPPPPPPSLSDLF